MTTPKEIEVLSGTFSAISIRHALSFLPQPVNEDLVRRLVIIGGDHIGAFHVPKSLRTTHEIVFLSDAFLREHDTPDALFISVVLHEVAHAYKRHRSKLYDHISQQEKDDQEAEADSLARSWYPEFINPEEAGTEPQAGPDNS